MVGYIMVCTIHYLSLIVENIVICVFEYALERT